MIYYLKGTHSVCRHKDCYNCPIQRCIMYSDGETRIEIDESSTDAERKELEKILARKRVEIVKKIENKGELKNGID